MPATDKSIYIYMYICTSMSSLWGGLESGGINTCSNYHLSCLTSSPRRAQNCHMDCQGSNQQEAPGKMFPPLCFSTEKLTLAKTG